MRESPRTTHTPLGSVIVGQARDFLARSMHRRGEWRQINITTRALQKGRAESETVEAIDDIEG